MHEKVAWLVERLEACAPRDGPRTADEASAIYRSCLAARDDLASGRGMVLGLAVSDCYPEAVDVLVPLVAQLIDEWERALLARFGEDAVLRMRILGGMTPSLEWWLEATNRQLDEVLRAAGAGTETSLDVRLAIVGRGDDVAATIEHLAVVITPPGQHRRVEPPYPGLAKRTLPDLRDARSLWRWAQQIVATRASLSSLDVRVEVTDPESQWPFVAAVFAELVPQHIRFTAWPGWFDRGPEPGGCSCNIVLAEGPVGPRAPGRIRVAVDITHLDPPDETTQRLHRWAAALAHASGAVLEAVWK